MRIHQFNIFIHLATIKNFTEVGRVLGYSQSNISAQIQQLESQLDGPLFNRTGRTVSLTQYGEELLPYAQEIVSTATKIQNFHRSDKTMKGTVKIGLVESIFDLAAEQTILNFHNRFPKVKIDLIVDSTSRLNRMLKQGLLDFACTIDDSPSKTEYHCWHIMDVPIVIVSNPNNYISYKGNLSLQDLEFQKFILMEQSATYTTYFENQMYEDNIDFTPVLKLQNPKMACKLVENGDFLSVLPYYSVMKSIQNNKIKILDVENFSYTQYVQIILHKNKVLIPQVEGFLEELKFVLERKIYSSLQ